MTDSGIRWIQRFQNFQLALAQSNDAVLLRKEREPIIRELFFSEVILCWSLTLSPMRKTQKGRIHRETGWNANRLITHAAWERAGKKQDSANVQIDIVELHKEAQQLIEHPRKEAQLGQSQSIADLKRDLAESKANTLK